MPSIRVASEDFEIKKCFPVMQELRPHLVEAEFVDCIRRQSQHSGYQLAYLEDEGDPRAVAGFRLSESLSAGKYLYVDDLVTASAHRSQGYGEALFQWLVDYARAHQCEQFQLDSGVQRFRAHRFYMRHGMAIAAHHFSMPL